MTDDLDKNEDQKLGVGWYLPYRFSTCCKNGECAHHKAEREAEAARRAAWPTHEQLRERILNADPEKMRKFLLEILEEDDWTYDAWDVLK